MERSSCVPMSQVPRSLIQVSPARASFTLLFFLRECLKSSGKAILRVAEPVQEQSQKEAVAPSPMVTIVAALKRALLVTSHGSSDPTQGLSGFFHANHSHLRRSARLNRCISWMPRPPLAIGEQTVGKFTLHLPPVSSSSCAHRKRRRVLSTSLKNLFGTLRTEIANVGSGERTQRTSTCLPAIVMSLPFHPASRALMRSRMNCR